jgi:hypothetical protein
MDAKASPTMRRELLTDAAVSRHRSLFCPEYDDCLEVAVNAGWTSWSCERCPLAKVVAMRAVRAAAAPALPEADAAHP